MADRTAIDTIRGYFYQFDYSILSLLKLSIGSESILVEGVEDIDITTVTETTAVQCKYYEKTEYNHSVIAEPIRLMLNHFKDVKLGKKTRLNYKLRGYYKSGHSKLILPLTIQNLKDNFLTYTRTKKIGKVNTKVKHFHHNELGLSDPDLNEFIGLLEIDINAIEFEKQFKEIISLFKTTFSCSDFSAEFYFYNSALRVIRDISKDSNKLVRNITKDDFLKRVNNSKILFNEWFLKLKGEKAHFANLRNEYFASLNILYKERFFILEINTSEYLRTEVKDIINILIKKYTKIINQPTPFCPYIYLHGISQSELIEIKKDIIEDGILINDGFEFEGSSFNPISILRMPNTQNQLKIKFINNLDNLKQSLGISGRKSEIYQFYLTDSFFDFNNPSVKEVKIQIKQTKDLKNII